jgi:hypothetical protein
MQIPSAFSSGIQGFQNAQNGLAQATIDVARATVTPNNAAKDSAAANSTSEQPDLTTALVSANQSVHQGEASAKVIEVASETLGTIIDIQV